MSEVAPPPPWRIETPAPRHRPALRRLFLEVRRSTFRWQPSTQFELADFDDETVGETMLVALLIDEPIGLVSWWPPQNFIHHLYVASECHRRGVGRALLRACLEQMGRPARLKCQCRNKGALAFYLSEGWEIEYREANENGEYFGLMLK